jgi:hypothetical protein
VKKCSKCGIEKKLNEDNFYLNKGKWHPHCKLCRKQYLATYYQNNKETLNRNTKEYAELHKEEIKEYQSGYRQTHQEEIKQYAAGYYADNKKELNRQSRENQSKPENKKKRNLKTKIKRQNNPNVKLKTNVSNSIRRVLKSNGSSKNGNLCLDYLPYTIEELKIHLENLFEPWMTWDNWGIYDPNSWNDLDSSTWTWQLDHIIPHSTFHYTSMEDQSFKDCWALNNLQPLSAKQNIIDGSNRTRH